MMQRICKKKPMFQKKSLKMPKKKGTIRAWGFFGSIFYSEICQRNNPSQIITHPLWTPTLSVKIKKIVSAPAFLISFEQFICSCVSNYLICFENDLANLAQYWFTGIGFTNVFLHHFCARYDSLMPTLSSRKGCSAVSEILHADCTFLTLFAHFIAFYFLSCLVAFSSCFMHQAFMFFAKLCVLYFLIF